MASHSRLLLIVLVGLVVLAGCMAGVDQPTNTEAAASPTPADPTVTPTTTPAESPTGTLEVHFINVGQSVSTLVVGPRNETMLIDTGHFHHDAKYVLEYLHEQDIDRIDHLVTSHNDADHIGGTAAVIEYYETEANGIGAVFDPGIAASTQTYGEYLDAVEAHDVTLYETREGDRIPFEGVDVQVLGPPEPYLANEERNENSIVLRLAFGNTSFLFTGDAGAQQEPYLVEQYGDQLRSTVMKTGHHGSNTSTSGVLLDAVRPAAVVVSSAYESQYGHPAEPVLRRLADRDVTTYWTATHGHVMFVSDGSQVAVHTQRAAPTDPVRLREGDPIEPGTTDPVEGRAVITDEAGVRTETPVATDGGTTPTEATAETALAIAEIHADAQDDDRENLNDEYVVLENTGQEPLNLGGWTVTDESGATYTVPEGFSLEPGAAVTLYTGSGTDTETELYWGSGRPIWNNGGDTITVRDANGTVVIEESYS